MRLEVDKTTYIFGLMVKFGPPVFYLFGPPCSVLCTSSIVRTPLFVSIIGL